jgi:hypothetical protein
MGPNRLTAILAAGAITAVAVLLAVPPWMVVDTDDPQVRHTALGHHPRWQPPPLAMAETALAEAGRPPRNGARPSLQVRVNVVRLTLELAGATSCVALLGLFLARRRAYLAGRDAARPSPR